MKLKKLLALGALTCCSAANAQINDWQNIDERIAYTCPDSVQEARGHVSTYQMALQNQDWNEAYISWKWLMEKAPYSITGIYKGMAPYMLYNLINASTDDAKKKQYFDDLMAMFEARQERLDDLNKMEKSDALRSTLGDVLAVKAEYYNWTAPNVPGSGYTLNKAWDNFATAIKMVNEQGGREITGGCLQTFFMVSDAIYKYYAGQNTPDVWREQYLQDYLDSKDACEKMLQLAKEAQEQGDTEKAEKLVATYDGPLAFIDQTFAASGAADRDQIIAIYTKKFDSYKTDINKLNNAINLMAQNGCDDSDIYYEYAVAAYNIQPTFTSSIGFAQKLQKEGKAQECLTYYNKALELAPNDDVRGNICLRVARALASSGAVTKSGEYVEKAISYNPNIVGKAYYQQAINLTKAHDFQTAVTYCDKAAESDITVAPAPERLKANLKQAIAANAANAKAQAEYQEYLRKKKAEEDFWKGGAK